MSSRLCVAKERRSEGETEKPPFVVAVVPARARLDWTAGPGGTRPVVRARPPARDHGDHAASLWLDGGVAAGKGGALLHVEGMILVRQPRPNVAQDALLREERQPVPGSRQPPAKCAAQATAIPPSSVVGRHQTITRMAERASLSTATSPNPSESYTQPSHLGRYHMSPGRAREDPRLGFPRRRHSPESVTRCDVTY